MNRLLSMKKMMRSWRWWWWLTSLIFFSYITVIYLLEFRILVGPLLLELRVKFRFSALSGFFWERRRGIKWELTTLQREIFLGFVSSWNQEQHYFFLFYFPKGDYPFVFKSWCRLSLIEYVLGNPKHSILAISSK